MIGVLSWSSWKRNGRRSSLALWTFLATLGLASCGGSIPKTQYYTLSVPAPPAASSDPKTTYILGVERFRAPEMLRDDRIVYYESPTQLNYYEYHRWSADPATLLTELAVQYLDRLGVFAEVRLLPIREPVDYTLRGRVLNFEEIDYGGGGKARVALELTLVRVRDRRVVWSARQQVETPIQEKGMAGVVNALNASSQQVLREVLLGVAEQVEQDFKGSQGQSH